MYAEGIALHRQQVSALQDSALSLDLDYTISFSTPKKPAQSARHIATIPAPIPTVLDSPDCEMDFDTPPF